MCAATVVLIGATGAGKTTTAQVLGEQYGWSTLDIDQTIEVEEGRSIAEIIRVEGEQYFRELEAKAITSALNQAFDAISVGAGAVMSQTVREVLSSKGALSVFLDVSAECAADRVLGDQLNGIQFRPMVGSGARPEIVGRITRLGEERRATYQSVARIRIVTEFASADTLRG